MQAGLAPAHAPGLFWLLNAAAAVSWLRTHSKRWEGSPWLAARQDRLPIRHKGNYGTNMSHWLAA